MPPRKNTTRRTTLENQILDDIKRVVEENRRPRIACLVDKSKKKSSFSPLSSRFGGSFAWPRNEAPPQVSDAFCLAQINLGDLPDKAKTLLPSEGILQFLVGSDNDTYGKSFDVEQQPNGDGYQVVLHSMDQDFDLMDGSKDSYDDGCDLPLGVAYQDQLQTQQGVPMKFKWEPSVPPSSNDYRIQKIYLDVMYNDKGEQIASSQFEERYDAFVDTLEDSVTDAPCWLLGHPHFAQEDIRTPVPDNDNHAGKKKKKAEPNWVSLLSFESNSDDLFMFGDAGTATVLVPEQDLQTLGLSQTWYSWDCS